MDDTDRIVDFSLDGQADIPTLAESLRRILQYSRDDLDRPYQSRDTYQIMPRWVAVRLGLLEEG